jgi:hypothetical protein
MKIFAGAVFGFLSFSLALGQQVGVLNLPLPESTPPHIEQNPEQLPSGCTKPTGTMADGLMQSPDHRRRTISLEIFKLSSQSLDIGGEGRAEVRLKNVGDVPITIPWSTDSGVIRTAPDPDVLQWEQANFGIVLLDQKNETIALKTADWPLYGSRFVDGSLLMIKPGEWATAFVDFKVEDLYHVVPSNQFPIGKSKLFLEWGQAFRARRREKCGWSSAEFDYGRGHYYKQEHPTIAVRINWSGSDRDPK